MHVMRGLLRNISRTIKAGSKGTFLQPESVLLPKCDILKRQHSVYKTSVESQCLHSLFLMNRGWQQRLERTWRLIWLSYCFLWEDWTLFCAALTSK